ncbi:glucuronate isomerase [Schleiferilactobacillus shenzhenensis]|uniref:Uronate isomerase n=1 Tax=Schleiferilactobacillus shenzhenensis LY-73 TaxID=1231336 RepID=U4TK64_9LACO|nr:glucuronate isomerase [Schleiferilactobacillus shenzhenensis]ERL65241.1 UxaC [Schleiferilactobacillus shenzhenensis LY-73]
MAFLDKDFLLTNAPAKALFHQYADGLPIIDFHCHLNPQEIYENKNFKNMTRIWINEGTYGDHYKWRLERANGVPEKLITGDGDDYEKFLAWADTMANAFGNPVFEWTHLELKRFFGIDEVLNRHTAPMIWKKANALLQTPAFKPQALIKNSNVQVVCTTDDPASDLHYQKLLAAQDPGFKVLPAMRPDKLVHIEAAGFGQYLEELSQQAQIQIGSFAALQTALEQRFQYFNDIGGRLSDHGLDAFHFVEASSDELDAILAKGVRNEKLTAKELDQYRTMLIETLMRLNKRFNWTMQFHVNAARNLSLPGYRSTGADTGYDAMGTQPDIVGEFRKLFTAMDNDGEMPKVIFYSLNPNDWMAAATMMQSFVGQGDTQHLQLGAAWWFNDTAEGMTQQLRTYAEQSLLPHFVGMLTDSRSFLSYPRHEYFRRVLCNFYGELIEQGRVPNDLATIGQVVQNISYYNARNYFGFFDQKD